MSSSAGWLATASKNGGTSSPQNLARGISGIIASSLNSSGKGLRTGTEAQEHRKYLQKLSDCFFQRLVSRICYRIPKYIQAGRSEHPRIENYEYRGNQPVGKLLVCTNIALWLLFVLFALSRDLLSPYLHNLCDEQRFVFKLVIFWLLVVADVVVVWRCWRRQ